MSTTDKILEFWFGTNPNQPLQNAPRWWKHDSAFDREIERLFRDDLKMACAGRFETWKQRPDACLAYIILLDQFSRNIYRNTPQAFAQDTLALQACLDGQKRKFESELEPVKRWFFYIRENRFFCHFNAPSALFKKVNFLRIHLIF